MLKVTLTGCEQRGSYNVLVGNESDDVRENIVKQHASLIHRLPTEQANRNEGSAIAKGSSMTLLFAIMLLV